MNTCEKWQDGLLETALSGKAAADLEQHLLSCSDCGRRLAELERCREQMDELLPQLARSAELSANFRARVLAAAGEISERRSRNWRWLLGAMAPALLALLIVSYVVQSRTSKVPGLPEAQALAVWRSPTDALLQTPGQEILRNTPRLGESYMKFEGEMK